MPELRLTGIHDDGENLVLESADGTTYLLPIDQNLRQSIARARRINPLRGGSKGTFGPREIQTRFRQGATVEEIAAESGWEPNRVRRYEWPIVAERANIIHTARSVMISPAPGQGKNAQSLNQHIEEVSARFGFEEAPMDWSTWQQESGQWTVSLDISLSDDILPELPRAVMFPARWNFNPANQSIYASNEAAYFLMGRDHSHDSPIPGLTPSSPQAPDATTAQEDEKKAPGLGVQVAPPKVTPVRVPQNKEQNELLDELSSRRGVRSFDPASERKLADLLERARRGSQSVGELHDLPAPDTQEAAETKVPKDHTAVSIADESVAEPQNGAPEENGQENLEALEQDTAAEEQSAEANLSATSEHQSNADSEDTDHASQAVSDDPQALPEGSEQSSDESDADSGPKAKPARGKRTSVPSWDDIIFGNQRR
ncbi:septation protein SepH [Rothia sp. CCM 9417]|uniref:septation protein SepH n=1 Tax=Rothia sp. CCM 9417 TaxID=3402657 RepID=UPI003AEE5582